MRSAIHSVNVVRETEDRIRVAVVVLQRHFERELATVGHIALGFKINRLLVQYRFALVQVLDKLRDAAAVMKLVRFCRLYTLVVQRDGQTLVEEGQFPQTLRKSVEVKLCRV